MAGAGSKKAREDRVSSHPADKQHLTCERWMSLKLHTVKPLDSVAHARALLEEHRINQLPVVTNDKLIGIVTDRDLRDAVNMVATSARVAGMGGQAPEQISIESVMSAGHHHTQRHSRGFCRARTRR